MQSYAFIFTSFVILFNALSSYGFTQEATISRPKILVLIIASDNKESYLEEQKIWRSYMHLDPEHVEAYFIKGDPELTADYEIRGDVIWSKSNENWIPGLTNKTILSMECLLPRLDEFDYVVRTNLSSFFIFPRLLDYLQTQSKTGLYCGTLGFYPYPYGRPFGIGCCLIFSTDLVRMMVENKHDFIDKNIVDDVLIGFYLINRGFELIEVPRCHFDHMTLWDGGKHLIPHDCYHIRCRNEKEELRATHEIFILKQLVQMFYHIQLPYP